MHVPKAFAVADPVALLREVTARHAVTLVTLGATGMRATMVPVVHRPRRGGPGRLVGHVAKANREVVEADGHGCLVVAIGAQGYISPGWYASKAEHGRVVPTWDYEMVEASGVLRTFTDSAELRRIVAELTERHEADRDEPWHVSDAPEDFIDALLAGIVGFEIELDRVQAKAKLSQNRPPSDVEGVVDALRDVNPALAAQVHRARTVGSDRD